jgi:hypothetical protein
LSPILINLYSEYRTKQALEEFGNFKIGRQLICTVVCGDYQVLKVKNWKELIGNRKEWNNHVGKAKTHPRL